MTAAAGLPAGSAVAHHASAARFHAGSLSSATGSLPAQPGDDAAVVRHAAAAAGSLAGTLDLMAVITASEYPDAALNLAAAGGAAEAARWLPDTQRDRYHGKWSGGTCGEAAYCRWENRALQPAERAARALERQAAPGPARGPGRLPGPGDPPRAGSPEVTVTRQPAGTACRRR